MNFARIRFPVLLAALFLSGCSRLPLPKMPTFVSHPAPTVHTYSPVNFSAGPALPVDVRRVVLLPLDRAGHATPEIARELDAIVLAALQKEMRFEVVTLSRAECRRTFGAESFNSTAALPRGFTERITRELAADALLFVDLTAHRSQRPLMLGLRAKLATADGKQLLWTFDEIVDASSPIVAKAVQDHFKDTTAKFQLGDAALRSPSRFAAFSAAAMFSTLPPR
ncbi:MAG TPA: hypothetical protein VMM36_09560 [Opitutaceae bacterium]|nr:hypothetical protein [Opitutaceae bacterium]